MDAKIGEIIEIYGVKLRVEEVVSDNNCNGCAGDNNVDLLCCDSPACSFIYREDKKSVIFKKVDDNETS